MRILRIFGPGPPDRLFQISKAGLQIATGLQASGVRDPADSVDISKEAKVAAETQQAACQTETSVQPALATPPVQDDEKKTTLSLDL